MSDGSIAPIAAVIPTRNRAAAFRRMVESLKEQEIAPAELIVVDASTNDETKNLVAALESGLGGAGCRVLWLRAERVGAAPQRNQGVAQADQPFVGFFDDDIVFQPGCLPRLFEALHADTRLGGVNATITNQTYRAPGIAGRLIARIMAGKPSTSYAGRVIGPAVAYLPDDSAALPDVVPVDWLNTTCTLYRREALPRPPFPPKFSGYSMFEDLALSLDVGKAWKLANVRDARIFHDSQPGEHKADAVALSRMELVNRHYVMTHVLQRRRLRDYAKLLLWEKFQLAACLVQKRGGREFWQMLCGKALALRDLLSRSRSAA